MPRRLSVVSVVLAAIVLTMVRWPATAKADPVPAVNRIATSQPEIFLTIDDGYTRDPRVVDLIRQEQLPVSLFLLEDAVNRDPEYFRALVRAGATAQNHTRLHPSLRGLSWQQQAEQVCPVQDSYDILFGQRPTLLRPPYGAFDRTTQEVARACGMEAVALWSAVAQSGRLDVPGGSLRPGDVVLFHFRPGLYDDLRMVIDLAHRSGLRIGRLEDYIGGPPTPPPCTTPGAAPHTPNATDLPALFHGGSWHLRPSLTGGPGDPCFLFGIPGDRPLMGDWNGDGVATPGVFRNGIWYLRNSNDSGPGDVTFAFGIPGDVPVVGDWNNDGVDTPGVFRDGIWYLRNSNTSGPGEAAFRYGIPGDVPVVGDWNNDGTDTLGVFRRGLWYLSNSFDHGVADGVFAFGNPGDLPVVGDWNNDGTDTIGVYRRGRWYVSNFFDRGIAEVVFDFGMWGHRPVAWR